MQNLRGLRKTKIVATMGPASNSPEMIRRLIRNGMNVARLNFSHGDLASHKALLEEIRAASKELKIPVGILQDLPGPKIRLGRLEGEILLAPGQEIRLGAGSEPEGDIVPVAYEHLVDDVQPGQRILLADGRVELMAVGKDDKALTCRVVVGGPISSHKGVSLPSSDLRISAFTEKDRLALEFGLKNKVDFVAMSFVRQRADLAPICEMISEADYQPLLIAKIEKPQAVENIDDILKAVDGLMIARGDMGVEMPLHEVPVIQKMLIKKGRQAGKITITATQMLRSMVDNPRPTRAEVTDVANAILDGTDAVMLSEESAVGKYPVDAVKVMNQVALSTEPTMEERRFLKEVPSALLPKTEGALSHSACWLARDIQASAIVASTASGSTARLIARYRMNIPVVGLTPSIHTYRQLCLSWGVHPALVRPHKDTDEMFEDARVWIAQHGIAQGGESFVITAGWPLHVKGTTNMVKVVDMEESQTEVLDNGLCGCKLN